MEQKVEKMAKDIKKGDTILSLGGALWRLRSSRVDNVTERNNGNIIELLIGGKRYLFGYNELIEVPAPRKPGWWTRGKTSFVKWIAQKLKIKVKVG